MQKPIQELAPRISDCLKVIFAMQEQGQKVSTSAVSERLRVSDATATMLFKDFALEGWVEHVPYRGVRLTAVGEQQAKEVIRHHRLLETYLARVLGYTWDKVHDEADRLEHVISEEFEDRLDQILGYPTIDPHGDPIPSKDGLMVSRDGRKLSLVGEGQVCRILRVSDQDPKKLCYLGKLGLYPDTRIEVLERAPFGGPLRVRIGEPPQQSESIIGVELTEDIIVSEPQPDGVLQ